MVSGVKRVTVVVYLALLAGCANTLPSGPVSVRVIQPVTGQRCINRVAAAQLDTLSSLSSLSGRMGKVVLFNGDIDANPQTLETGSGFFSIDTQFIKGSDGYVASDYRSLLGASLYYAAETGQKLHARLNPAADFLQNDRHFGHALRQPGFAGTRTGDQDFVGASDILAEFAGGIDLGAIDIGIADPSAYAIVDCGPRTLGKLPGVGVHSGDLPARN